MSFDVHFIETATVGKLGESPVPSASGPLPLSIPMSAASSTQSTNCHTPLSSDGGSSSSSVSESYLHSLPGDVESNKKIATMAVTYAKANKAAKRPRQAHYPDRDDTLSPPASLEDETEGSRSHYKLRVRKSAQVTDTPDFDYEFAAVTVAKMLQPTEIQPIESFAQRFGVPRPEYEHILENDYSKLEEQWRREDPDVPSNQSAAAADLRRRESRLWVCDCTPPSAEELMVGRLACGQGCINRALYIECAHRRCPAWNVCSNRQFQLRLYARTEPYYCGPEKGWGLRALVHIPKGTFIVEYSGEVIDFPEFRKRIRLYEKAKRAHHYFMSLGPEHFIDAGTKGNWARFVNHSCEPNAETLKWTVNGRLRIGFFAKCDIEAMEEITIDYQFVQYGITEQKCYCGTHSCSGIMGSSSKQLQDKVRLKDTRAVERHILQLLASNTLRSAEDVTFLLQVMVQEYLTRYTRMELLKLLADTKNETYLKLFRQYNGLELLTSYMCDAATNDWQLKHRLLICLDNIPVSEQQQVQTDSNLMEIVGQWLLDPRYCRPRANVASISTTPSPSALASEEDEAVDVELHVDGCSEDVGKNKPTHAEADTVQSQAQTKVPNGSVESVKDEKAKHNESAKLQPSSTFNGATEVLSKPLLPVGKKEEEEEDKFRGRMGQLELANAVKVYSASDEQIVIRRIRKLAARILKRWSALPFETYRIPRREREETEQSIARSTDPVSSALEPWGISSEENDFTSWSLFSKDSSSSGRNNGSSMTVQTSRSLSQRYRHDVSRELRRTKHRKQFEADMDAAESAAASLLSTKPSQNQPPSAFSASSVNAATNRSDHEIDKTNVAESVRSLLFKTLARQLSIGSSKTKGVTNGGLTGGTDLHDTASSLQETMSHLSKKLCEFAKKQDTQGLLAYLQALSEDTTPVSSSLGTVVVGGQEKESSTTASYLPRIPPPWCSAVDQKSGRIYYYNTISKAVQWHHPASSNDNIHMATASEHTSSPGSASINNPKKKDFLTETYACILKLLRPFRLPNCLTGRIESDEDMKYLAKRFAFALSEREQRRFQSDDLHINSAMVDRFRRKVVHYMTSRGPVYVRTKEKEAETETDVSQISLPRTAGPEESSVMLVEGDDDCDMDVDDTES